MKIQEYIFMHNINMGYKDVGYEGIELIQLAHEKTA
jgi:hypothetical protein